MDHAPESAHYDSLTGISNEPNLYCEEIGTDEENSDTAVEAFDLTRERNAKRERNSVKSVEAEMPPARKKIRMRRCCPQTTR